MPKKALLSPPSCTKRDPEARRRTRLWGGGAPCVPTTLSLLDHLRHRRCRHPSRPRSLFQRSPQRKYCSCAEVAARRRKRTYLRRAFVLSDGRARGRELGWVGSDFLAGMPPPPGLTKADVANFVELYQNEEGGQARFAVYVGKPGPKAWCPVKDLAEARRKAGDMNSVQSVRRCVAPAPPLPPRPVLVCPRRHRLPSGRERRSCRRSASRTGGPSSEPAAPPSP